MTIRQVFEEWKKINYIGNICEFGGIEGGPGYIGFGECKHPKHTTVKYGCDSCPINCPEFECKDNDDLFNEFLISYRMNPNFYNSKYHIDENDMYYKRSFRPTIEIKHEVVDPTELF